MAGLEAFCTHGYNPVHCSYNNNKCAHVNLIKAQKSMSLQNSLIKSM